MLLLLLVLLLFLWRVAMHCRGKVSCRRLWQIGLEHLAAGDDDTGGYGYGGDDAFYDDCNSEAAGSIGMGGGSSAQRGICNWLRGSPDPGHMARGTTGLWVNVYDSSSPQPGKVLLVVQRSQRELPPGAGGDVAGGVLRAGGGGGGGQSKATLKVSSCQAYDYILLAALKSQVRVPQGGAGAQLLVCAIVCASTVCRHVSVNGCARAQGAY